MLEMVIYLKEEYHTGVDRFKSVALKYAYAYRKLFAVQNSELFLLRINMNAGWLQLILTIITIL